MPMTLKDVIKTRGDKWPHRIDIQRSTNHKNTDDDMRAWCEERCKGDYTILRLGNDLYIARFTDRNDMMLFTLTWS
jgi:hypothetical protein